jgi:hypothetical protein
MACEAVELLQRLALDAGEKSIQVYAPGIAELAKFYLDHTRSDGKECDGAEPVASNHAVEVVADLLRESAHEWRQSDDTVGMFADHDAADLCETLAVQICSKPPVLVNKSREFGTPATSIPSSDGAEPVALHPATADLVQRFARALAEKLAAAEAKYGYSDGWRDPNWMDECRAKLIEHVSKGDPRDVAAYCAFLWHHGESTRTPVAGVTDVQAVDLLIKLYEAADRKPLSRNFTPELVAAAKTAIRNFLTANNAQVAGVTDEHDVGGVDGPTEAAVNCAREIIGHKYVVAAADIRAALKAVWPYKALRSLLTANDAQVAAEGRDAAGAMPSLPGDDDAPAIGEGFRHAFDDLLQRDGDDQ